MPRPILPRAGGALAALARGAAATLRELLRRAGRHRLSLHAAALSYTTLVSLVPTASVVFAGAALVAPEKAAALVKALAQLLPYSPEQVQETLAQLAQKTAALGAVALVLAFFSALSALLQIEQAFVAMAEKRHRRRWVRVGSFAFLVLLGPFLLAGFFALEAALAIPGLLPWLGSLRSVLSFLGGLAALTLVYRFFPPTLVPWRAAGLGALVGTSSVLLLSAGVKLYLRLFPELDLIYGPLSLLLVLLVSLMLFWFVVLLGGELALLSAFGRGQR